MFSVLFIWIVRIHLREQKLSELNVISLSNIQSLQFYTGSGTRITSLV